MKTKKKITLRLEEVFEMNSMIFAKGGRNCWEQLVPESFAKHFGQSFEGFSQTDMSYFLTRGQTFRLVLSKFDRACRSRK